MFANKFSHIKQTREPKKHPRQSLVVHQGNLGFQLFHGKSWKFHVQGNRCRHSSEDVWSLLQRAGVEQALVKKDSKLSPQFKLCYIFYKLILVNSGDF